MAVALNDGRDARVLPALTDYSILQLGGEAGTDLARWPTAKHFTAWLRLVPGAHQSGKRASATGRDGHFALWREKSPKPNNTCCENLPRSIIWCRCKTPCRLEVRG